MEVQDWIVPQQELSIAEMDNLVKTYREARLAYEKAKEESSRLYHILEEAENQVRNALTEAGKNKYFVDGVGTVSLAVKSSFTTPKTVEDKLKLFDYIKFKYGDEALINYLSIHSSSLNSFANRELESDPTLTIPGLTTPTVTTELRFRKD